MTAQPPAGPSPYAGTSPVVSVALADAVVTLVEGQTFFLSGRTGNVAVGTPHGLFFLDTRVLSRWELRLNGHLVEPLTVTLDEPFAATFVGRGHPSAGHADGNLVLVRHRAVGQGMRERMTLTNHGLEPAPVLVEIDCDVDFADLFEVKEGRVRRRGMHGCAGTDAGLRYVHSHDGMERSVEVACSVPPRPDDDDERLRWQRELGPGESWELCVEVRVTLGDTPVAPLFRCAAADEAAVPHRRLAAWRAQLPELDSPNAALAQAVRRTGEDLGALRIFDPDHPDRAILAAGAPWFMTVFGRDSVLTAWMTLLADHSLARGVLETLTRFQGIDVDERTEEEPGKILHEMRFGSAAGLALGGGDIYYGSIDATPLFVMLLGELQRWEGADDVVDALLPAADRALEWIEHHGDRDGDGYVEYERRSAAGLANQGWKDSWDGIRFADGRLARPPIALCEVQGYVYAAYVARAHFARERGDQETFDRYVQKATDLRRRFNEDFWLEERGCYALGLEGLGDDKVPIDAVASNMGHCLWTGIVDEDRAASVARHLVSPELFSGFGVRTLATSMAAYNPVSYHNGSVWPHDTALCAAGLARYRFVEEAHRLIEGQLAAAAVHHGRLPELFAGFSRQELGVPAAYPTSCSPQAWAAASPLLWLRTLLRLEPWTSHGRLWIYPELPPWIPRLGISGISIAGRSISVTVEGGHVEVEGADGLEVVHQPRPPLTPTIDPAALAAGRADTGRGPR